MPIDDKKGVRQGILDKEISDLHESNKALTEKIDRLEKSLEAERAYQGIWLRTLAVEAQQKFRMAEELNKLRAEKITQLESRRDEAERKAEAAEKRAAEMEQKGLDKIAQLERDYVEANQKAQAAEKQRVEQTGRMTRRILTLEKQVEAAEAREAALKAPPPMPTRQTMQDADLEKPGVATGLDAGRESGSPNEDTSAIQRPASGSSRLAELAKQFKSELTERMGEGAPIKNGEDVKTPERKPRLSSGPSPGRSTSTAKRARDEISRQGEEWEVETPERVGWSSQRRRISG